MLILRFCSNEPLVKKQCYNSWFLDKTKKEKNNIALYRIAKYTVLSTYSTSIKHSWLHIWLFSSNSVITVNHNARFKLHHFLPSADWLVVMANRLYHQTKWQTIMCSSCEQQPEPESHWHKSSLDSRTFSKFCNSRTLNSDFYVRISFVLCWVTR